MTAESRLWGEPCEIWPDVPANGVLTGNARSRTTLVRPEVAAVDDPENQLARS